MFCSCRAIVTSNDISRSAASEEHRALAAAAEITLLLLLRLNLPQARWELYVWRTMVFMSVSFIFLPALGEFCEPCAFTPVRPAKLAEMIS